jgi:hypothetical protein
VNCSASSKGACIAYLNANRVKRSNQCWPVPGSKLVPGPVYGSVLWTRCQLNLEEGRRKNRVGPSDVHLSKESIKSSFPVLTWDQTTLWARANVNASRYDRIDTICRLAGVLTLPIWSTYVHISAHVNTWWLSISDSSSTYTWPCNKSTPISRVQDYLFTDSKPHP